MLLKKKTGNVRQLRSMWLTVGTRRDQYKNVMELRLVGGPLGGVKVLSGGTELLKLL